MSQYHREMLAAARLLLAREQGQRGRLSSARVRRSISTAYYAIFHFVEEECATRVVGSAGSLLRQRRIFARTFTHFGLRAALTRVAGPVLAPEFAAFLLPAGATPQAPAFASAFADAFVEAQNQRHAADYDLNAKLGEVDASRMIDAVEQSIAAWNDAVTPADRDFKHALCLLMVLGGKLRNG